MAQRLLQHRDLAGARRVIFADGDVAHFVKGVETTLALAQIAIDGGTTLAEAAQALVKDEAVELAAELAAGRLLPAIDHPDAARLMLAGTGLTHLGSAAGRDAMHKAAAEGKQTDSMRLVLEGMEGGRPAPGTMPEWPPPAPGP